MEKRQLNLLVTLLCTITVILAACSLVYELLIAQTISLLAANTVVWYSVVVGVYLAAMGLGALVADRFMSNKDVWILLVWTEICLSISGVCAVSMIKGGHILYSYFYIYNSDLFGTICFFGSALIGCFVVGTLTGLELPLLIRIAKDETNGKLATNHILAADYLGALVGGLAFPLVLKPHFDPLSAAVVTALINLAIGAGILFAKVEGTKKSVAPLLAILATSVLASSILINSTRIQQYFLRKYYYYQEAGYALKDVFKPAPQLPEVQRSSSVYQKIDIVKSSSIDSGTFLMPAYTDQPISADPPTNYYLFLNGDFQLGSSYEQVYHEYFAHMPILARGKVPKKILVLGGGDGLLIRELLKYPSVTKIQHIDLDSVLVDLGRHDPILSKLNQHSYDDPRVQTNFADGFQFVRINHEKFDAIYIDFPVAVNYDLARLYSSEFYHFIRKNLTEDGYAVFDSTGTGLFSYPDENGHQEIDAANDWPVYYHTLRAAGFGSIIPYVSNLEFYNERAAQLIRASGVLTISDPAIFQYATLTQNDEEIDVLSKLQIRKTLQEHAISLQQGFIMMTPDIMTPAPEFYNFGVDFHILNPERYKLAFKLNFPTTESTNLTFVNSIVRPVFPTTPVWMPRLPF